MLVITLIPFYSHQIDFRYLALNKYGHELTVVIPIPIKNSASKNYTEIDLSDLNSQIKKQYDILVS